LKVNGLPNRRGEKRWQFSGSNLGLPMQAKENFSILLVDDDLMMIRIMNCILTDFAPLRFATSGRAALKLARESTPDLVLLDVDMPEYSGFEVCKAFKSDPALAEVPIIFITSHESAQLEAKGLELGAADFIGKPPHAPLVLARVRTYQRLKTLSETVRSAVKMDFLTGAVTRRQIEKALTHEWLRVQRSAAPLAFLLADIEGFTAYNAEFGDEQGDACLKSVADVLRSVARRPTDLLGRYAGGKFALLLANTDSLGASRVAQRAIEGVHALQILQSSQHGGRIALLMGAGCRDLSRSTAWTATVSAVPSDLIAAAEQALIYAKAAGDHKPQVLDVADLRHSTATSGLAKI
jgi:diguanylate cyclase (GGDEF)-like protein